MDDDTFDRLARRFESLISRRATLGALAGTGLLAALGGPGLEGQAKNKGKCKPKPRAVTCRGKCGQVRNNCKKKVDCGTCPDCQLCSAAKVCQPDPGLVDDPCGEEGQVCLANGTCACQSVGNTCGNGRVCLNGTCQLCAFVGGPCCNDNFCQRDVAACNEQTGLCESCGNAGQLCCITGSTLCQGGLTCTNNRCG